MDYGGGHQHEMAYPFPNQKLHSWRLGMDKLFHSTHYKGCKYMPMLGLKLFHVNTRALYNAEMPSAAKNHIRPEGWEYETGPWSGLGTCI